MSTHVCAHVCRRVHMCIGMWACVRGWACECLCVHVCVREPVCRRVHVSACMWVCACGCLCVYACVCIRAHALVRAHLECLPWRWGAFEGERAVEKEWQKGLLYRPTQTSSPKSLSFITVTHYLGIRSCLLWLTTQDLKWVPFLHWPFGQTASVCFGAMQEQVRNSQTRYQVSIGGLRWVEGWGWYDSVAPRGHPSVKPSGPLRSPKI